VIAKIGKHSEQQKELQLVCGVS